MRSSRGEELIPRAAVDEGEEQAPVDGEPPASKVVVIGVILIAAIAAQRPFDLWNFYFPLPIHVTRAFIVALGVFSAGLVLAAVIRKWLGRDLRQAFAVTIWTVFVFDNWNTLWDRVGPSIVLGAIAAVVILGVGFFLFTRAERRGVILFAVPMLAVVVLAPIGELATKLVQADVVALPEAQVPQGARLTETPDVYVVVLDAYARGDVLRELFGAGNQEFVAWLEDAGFVVPEAATSNYPSTLSALPSMLAMDYVLREGDRLDLGIHITLQRITGGENPFVRSLKQRGYRYVHLEGGIAQSRCGSEVDRCVSAPVLDESVWLSLERTPLRGVMRRRWGSYFTQSGLDRLEQLRRMAGAAETKGPTLVFAHVLLPHPPLFLGRGCAFGFDERLDGLAVRPPKESSTSEVRKDAYVAQVRCVNQQIRRFIGDLDEDSVVVFTGDHGPDSLGQSRITPLQWSDQQVRERQSIFQAIRVPARCRDRIPDDISLVNTLRVVMGCLMTEDMGELPNRLFLHSDGRDGSTVQEAAMP